MRRSLFFGLLILAGCSQILGLEDRDLVSLDGGLDSGTVVDSGTDTGVSPGCAEYCNNATELCTKDAGLQLFQTPDNCLAVCAKYPTDPSPTGNTLACRLQKLAGLRATGSNEAATTCPPAAPGGGPAPSEPNATSCGTNCEGFCALRAKVCPQMAGDIDCVRKCGALVDDTPYNADADFGSGADTLSCRIAHLSAATYYGSVPGMEKARDDHCSHSGIRSETQCDFKDPIKIDCKSYCKLVGTACTGDNAVYTSTAECETFCEGLESGLRAETTKLGTRRCLRDKAYSALESGPSFCPAAGPPGDQCDGNRCGSYCFLAQKACPDGFASEFPNGAAECQQKCLGLPGATGKYSVTQSESNGGDNMQCRIKRVTRLLGGTSTSPVRDCAGALGQPNSDCR